ncbi:hypothetical protein [Winogradskyella sp.]|uniref:hypothetical protein n=1 Tax=Winogradskyella sp. TaxID=1883156 RepID=UPI0025D9E841|nr:hypothetical protein [Winogradskyella sp.]MBT8244412.1 hypothetical protein [Winogradskyella sp.]
MKEKLKIYLKIKAILIGICFVAFSCTNDDFTEPIQKQTLKKLDFTGYILPTDSIFRSNSVLKNHVLSKFPNKPNEFSRTLESETLGFGIDTTRVMILRSDNFDSYTFTVEREDYDDTVLENYVVTYYSNNRYTQFLTSYPILEDSDGTVSFDVPNATITSINDSSLLFRGVECASYAQEWQAGECFDVNCGGSSGSGTHGPGDNCNAEPGDQPYTWCEPGTWVNTYCVQYISEDGGGGSTTTGGGGGNSNNNDDNDDDDDDDDDAVEFPTVPLDDDFGRRRECKKAMRFLENNPNFKTLLLGLNNDLDEDFEKSISKFENITPITVDQGTTNQAEVRLLTLPGYVYEGYAHTHYETNTTPEGDTYSVFSIEDLVGTAKIINMDLADTGSFVMFLSTGKGTHYAMTINNKARFLKFFNYALNKNNPPLDLNELNEWLDSKDLYQKLEKEFYNDTNAVIKKTNTDNDQVLEAFLQFMDEADMGATLLKTDENFNDFSRVRYKPNLGGNNIEEKPCNN